MKLHLHLYNAFFFLFFFSVIVADSLPEEKEALAEESGADYFLDQAPLDDVVEGQSKGNLGYLTLFIGGGALLFFFIFHKQGKNKAKKRKHSTNDATPPKKMVPFAWERNSCFANSVLQIFVACIPPMIDGGIEGVISWKERFKEPKTPEEGVAKAFGELVAAVQRERKKEKPATLSKEPNAVRMAMGEINKNFSSGAADNPLNFFARMYYALQEALKEKAAKEYDLKDPFSLDERKEKVMAEGLLPFSSLFGFTFAERLYNFVSHTATLEISTGFLRDPSIGFDSFEKKKPLDFFDLIKADIEAAQMPIFDDDRAILLKKESDFDPWGATKKITHMPTFLPIIIYPEEKNWTDWCVKDPFQELCIGDAKYALCSIVLKSSKGENRNTPHIVAFTQIPGEQGWWYLNDLKRKAEKKGEADVKAFLENKETHQVGFGYSLPIALFYRKEGTSPWRDSKPKSQPLLDLSEPSDRHIPFDPKGITWVESHKVLEDMAKRIQKKIFSNNKDLALFQAQLPLLLADVLERKKEFLPKKTAEYFKKMNEFLKEWYNFLEGKKDLVTFLRKNGDKNKVALYKKIDRALKFAYKFRSKIGSRGTFGPKDLDVENVTQEQKEWFTEFKKAIKQVDLHRENKAQAEKRNEAKEKKESCYIEIPIQKTLKKLQEEFLQCIKNKKDEKRTLTPQEEVIFKLMIKEIKKYLKKNDDKNDFVKDNYGALLDLTNAWLWGNENFPFFLSMQRWEKAGNKYILKQD